MPILTLPPELQLLVAQQLKIDDAVALSCACRAAAPLLTSTAVFGFNLAIKPLELPDHKFQGSFDRLRERDHVRCELELHGSTAADLSPDMSGRKKGQLAPLHRADDLQGVSVTVNSDLSALRCEGDPSSRKAPRTLAARLPSSWLSIAFDPNNSFILLHQAGGLESQVTSCGFQLRQGLVKVDLSRAQHLESVHCSGLTGLREAILPATVRAVAFDGCTALQRLRAPAGDAALVSLNIDGCRSLRATTLDGFGLSACEELVLSWCRGLPAKTLAAALGRAHRLRSASLRGLALEGVAEALLSSPAPLSALDVGFATGLASEAVQQLMRGRAQLTRCSLRGAKTLSRDVYNEVVQLMHERNAGNAALRDGLHGSFYYLKRGDGGSGSGDA